MYVQLVLPALVITSISRAAIGERKQIWGRRTDGTRLAHHLETEAFRVPPGWRIPAEICTLSRVDLSFRRALLAAIAYLLFPTHYADLAPSFQSLSREDTCNRFYNYSAQDGLRHFLLLTTDGQPFSVVECDKPSETQPVQHCTFYGILYELRKNDSRCGLC